MDVILNQREMLARFPRPKITTFSDRKSKYNEIVDYIGIYEKLLKNNTLTPTKQTQILTAISEGCSFWLTEDKGQHVQQGRYLYKLKQMTDNILKQPKTFCRATDKWYAMPFAWEKAFTAAKRMFSEEPFEFYVAVQKWIHQMFHSRNGAWYILTNFLSCTQHVNVQLQEGTMDPTLILGKPSTSINIPSHMYAQMAEAIRRAHQTMFDPAIDFMERNTQWQHVETKDYFRALNKHVTAKVSGPW